MNTSDTIKAGKEELEDSAITFKIKSIFLTEKLLGEEIAPISINVKTEKGVVFLTGTAKNSQQVKTAEKLAKEVQGVKSVKSDVTIKS